MNALVDYVSIADNQGVVIAIATIVMAITAVFTTILTFGLFRENRFLRKAGTEPEVIAYLMLDPRFSTMINFALINIGQGPAKNVAFSIEADEADFKSHNVKLSIKMNRVPISLLPQGEKITTFFGSGHESYAEPRLSPFTVKVQFENIKGQKRSSSSVLDVSQFDGMGTLGSPAEHEIAESLKKIAIYLNSFRVNSGRLQVETITTDQARKERDEWLEKVRN